MLNHALSRSLLQRYYLVYTGLIVIQLVGWYVLAVDTNDLTLEGSFLPIFSLSLT